MALTTIEGQKNNLILLDVFCADLDPVINQLNAVLDKYKIADDKQFISFPVTDNKVVPFISYSDGILSGSLETMDK